MTWADVKCHCNGNPEYDFKLGKEIGECRTEYPLGSTTGRLWCYIDQNNSGCDDKIDEPARGVYKRLNRYISFKACEHGQFKKRSIPEFLPRTWFTGER